MGMKVRDIFKISLFKGTVVLGGKNGLDNEIEWFNLMEIVDTISSLQPGEFLISTAFGFDDDKVSKGLIAKLKDRGLSGIGIQVGYYIKKVPQHLIKEGDDLDFPILLIPPKITFSHITKALYKELMAKEEEGEKLESANSLKTLVADLIEGKKISYQQEKYLEEYAGKDEYTSTHLWALSIAHIYDGIVLRLDINNCLKAIETLIENQDGKCHIEAYQGIYIILFKCPLSHRENLYKEAKQILLSLNEKNINLHYLVGYSSQIQGVETVLTGFREAMGALQSLISIGAKRGILSYQNVDGVKPLQKNEIKEGVIKYARQIIEPIIKSDKTKGTQYYITLKTYIAHNFNQSETAKALKIHRHTLSNRLEGIKKLINADYMDAVSYLKYHLAITIYELYK